MESISAQYKVVSPSSRLYPAKDHGRQDTPSSADRSGSSDRVDTVSISPEAASKSENEKIKKETDKLKQNEEKVKSHEAAHKAAGGQFAGAVSYQYQSGPDGRQYVVGGEVQIDLSPGATPDETISKMQVVIRAAMAPSDPSGQDRAVAAQAAAIMGQAQQEKAKNASGSQEKDTSSVNGPDETPARTSRPISIYA